MPLLLFSPETKDQLDKFLMNPTSALLLQGPIGSGKTTTLTYLATKLLTDKDQLSNSNPYLLQVVANEKQIIPIDKIRDINHFLIVKVPAVKQGINRVITIDDSELMPEEAQNALLKNLEEPPSNTVFLLTTSNINKILPTIRSRCTIIRIIQPTISTLKEYLLNQNLNTEAIDLAINISGGKIGLALDIASTFPNHPLTKAAKITRELLISSRYDKLSRINSIYKDRDLVLDIVTIIEQMAMKALETAKDDQVKRWNNILKNAYSAKIQLNQHSNTKLTLTNLMLNL